MPVRAARADDADDAEALASQAEAVGQAGDVAGAVGLLKQAIALDDLPRYRCLLGAAYYKLEQWSRAHLMFGICLEHTGSLKTEYVSSVTKVYAYAEKQLRAGDYGPVELRVSPATARITVSAFDDDESFTAPRTVWLPLGDHEAMFTVNGYVTKTVTVTARKQPSDPIVVDLEPTPTVTPGDDGDGGDGDGIGIDLTPGAGATDGSRAPARGGAYIAFGFAGASLIGGVVFHALALGTVGELRDLPSGTERDDKVDELKFERTLMFGLYTVGAVAAGIGIYLWMTAKPPSEGVAVGAAPTGDSAGGMVWLHWRR